MSLASCKQYVQYLQIQGNTDSSLVELDETHQYSQPESLETIKTQLQKLYELSAFGAQ